MGKQTFKEYLPAPANSSSRNCRASTPSLHQLAINTSNKLPIQIFKTSPCQPPKTNPASTPLAEQAQPSVLQTPSPHQQPHQQPQSDPPPQPGTAITLKTTPTTAMPCSQARRSVHSKNLDGEQMRATGEGEVMDAQFNKKKAGRKEGQSVDGGAGNRVANESLSSV